jgi:Protein of unknown function (DUF1501)
MLRVLGGPKRFCDGLTRRELLQVGSLGFLGLGLPQPPVGAREPNQDAGARLPGFGQAKSCILLFMYGSPSQLETFDPKPDAPVEVRGELGCIPSSVVGLNICERLPRLAQVMDKVSLIRSVSHPYPIHGVAFATTGIPRIELPMEINPRDPNHWPFIGSVVDYIAGRQTPVNAVFWARRSTRRVLNLSDAEPPKPGKHWPTGSGKTPSPIAALLLKAGFN